MESQLEVNLPIRSNISLKDVPLVRHNVSKTRCGYYTCEWIARAIGMHPVPSNDILKGRVWMDLFRPIFPRDMMALFKFRGMQSMEINLSRMTDDEKITWIKKEVALKRKPPALLIRAKPVHWIAVAGYDDERQVFYVYDSIYGDSSNNPFLPIGNASIGYNELIQKWRGRYWLKYKAIVITTEVKK